MNIRQEKNLDLEIRGSNKRIISSEDAKWHVFLTADYAD